MQFKVMTSLRNIVREEMRNGAYVDPNFTLALVDIVYFDLQAHKISQTGKGGSRSSMDAPLEERCSASLGNPSERRDLRSCFGMANPWMRVRFPG
jgi:hypothetical protein